MNADEDGLIPIPTLDGSITVDSYGTIIDTRDCCVICGAGYHCIGCHRDPRL